MKNIIEIFKALESTNSVKDKEQILKQEIDNVFLQDILRYTLDPYKMFYIQKMPVYEKKGSLNEHTAFFTVKDLLDKLSERQLTGNAAKDAVIGLFSKLERETAELYERVLLKKAIGVGAKTVNKVWPNLVPEFGVMLAPNKIADITKLSYPIYVQPKLDGFRCLYIPHNGEVELWSRAGRPFRNKNLIEYFDCLGNTSEYVLDGELYHHSIPFQKLTSILNSEDTKLPSGLKFFVYDCVKLDDWLVKNKTKDYEDRLSDLRVLVNSTIADYNKVIDVPTDLAEDAAQIKDLYTDYLKNNYEGVMIKSTKGTYQWKRVTENSEIMLKLKPFKSLDLKVTGIYDGEGNFEGKAGGIIVDHSGHAVRIGTGFDLATREEMAKQPSKFISKTAEIKYFEETKDGSLRFPIFMRWRLDK